MSDWPAVGTIKAALVSGFAEIFTTEDGRRARALRSSAPWIIWIPPFGAACTRCDALAENPPQIKVDAGGPGEESKGNSPAVYAQHLLVVLLNPFFKQHLDCQPAIEVEPELEQSASV